MRNKLIAGASAVLLVCGSVPQIGSSASLTSFAEETVSGDFIYETKENADEVRIAKYTGSDTAVVIPAQIDGKTVVEIGSAFCNNTDLQSVVISDGIEKIGDSAFSGCTSLTEVTIPDSVISIEWYAFRDTPWLEDQKSQAPMIIVNDILIDGTACEGNVVVPETVRAVSDGAFRGCTYLTGITIPEGITDIGEVTFWECPNLMEVNLPGSIRSIGELAFWDCTSLRQIVIPDGVTDIAYGTFNGCTNLESITIPDSVVNIDSNAFSDTSWLKARQAEDPLVIVNDILVDGSACSGDVVIPDNVKSIGRSMFKSNEELTGITIPEGVTAIGEDAFWGCTNLLSVTIPKSVAKIGRRAFADCKSLTSVVLPDGITDIPDELFSGCRQMKSITLPESVTSIGYAAFEGCVQLSEITLPESVTAIGAGAFSYCRNLKTIRLPAGIKTITAYTFCGCESLTEIVIPEGVTSIGDEAFESSGLVNVTIPESVTNIDWLAFYSTPWIAARQEENPLVIVNGMLIDGTACEGEVIIPDGVERIIANAFRKMPDELYTDISSVTIPKTAASIDSCLYETCATEVTFLNSRIVIPSQFTVGTYITTIIGYDGSTAQAFAEENGLEFRSLGAEPEWISGDVNGDGSFSVSDIVRLQKWLLAVPDTHIANWKAADLCENDKLDVFDLCMMKRALIQQQQ